MVENTTSGAFSFATWNETKKYSHERYRTDALSAQEKENRAYVAAKTKSEDKIQIDDTTLNENFIHRVTTCPICESGNTEFKKSKEYNKFHVHTQDLPTRLQTLLDERGRYFCRSCNRRHYYITSTFTNIIVTDQVIGDQMEITQNEHRKLFI